MTDQTYRHTLDQIAEALDALYIEAQELRDKMAELEKLGIIDAIEHWRN